MPKQSIENIYLTDQTVSINVRRRRLELGYTQQAVAKALGVSVQQLQKYEKCINRLTSGKLEVLAKLLGVPIDYFFQSDQYDRRINLLNDKIKENLQDSEPSFKK